MSKPTSAKNRLSPSVKDARRRAKMYLETAVAFARTGKCDEAIPFLIDGAMWTGSAITHAAYTSPQALSNAGSRLKHISRTIVAACRRPGAR